MKQIFISMTMVVFFSFSCVLSVKSQDTKYATIAIKTSAQCGRCKDRIEKALAYEKGVISSDLDLKTKIVTVKYRSDKTTPDKIRKAISAVGHDADDVPADSAAYSKLPACCKKP